MITRNAVILAASLLAMTLSVRAQTPDDQLWAEFITYLKAARRPTVPSK